MTSISIQRPLLARLLEIAQRELDINTAATDLTSPLASLGDSLDFVDLLSAIESDFGISISNERLGILQTVGDLAAAVQATLAEQATPRLDRA